MAHFFGRYSGQRKKRPQLAAYASYNVLRPGLKVNARQIPGPVHDAQGVQRALLLVYIRPFAYLV